MHTHAGKDVFQVKTAGKMAFESQIEKGRHSVTINSGGHPDNMIHFEGTGAGARLSTASPPHGWATRANASSRSAKGSGRSMSAARRAAVA